MIGSRQELLAQGVVEVVVPDLAAALVFYRALGFEVQRATPSFVVLRWNELQLFVAEDRAATAVPRWTNLRIVVDDVDAMWERVMRLQLPVTNSIGDRAYGLRDFTVRDPGGFELRFAQVIAAAEESLPAK